jgi:hypothetical protein
MEKNLHGEKIAMVGGGGGAFSKQWGGGGGMVKAGVRYIRIPDPVHVFSKRGGMKTDNHLKRCLIKI